MASTIKTTIAKEMQHLKIDARLVRTIGQYERHFVNKSEEHINFLGGNLLGTPRFRFHSSDRDAWFDEVLKVDDVVLKNEIHSLEVIDTTHRVSSDVFNQSVFYLVHVLATSDNLSGRQKEQGMMDTLRVLHYRFLSSLMSHNFPYEPDRTVAEATYANLNYKFSLKQHGSWSALITARCEDIISKNSLHHNTIMRYDDDEAILRMIADVQGRIREVVKKMMRVFYEIKNSPTRISSRSSRVDLDGEMHVRDLTRQASQFKRYAHNAMQDRSTFIRPELTRIVADITPSMAERHLVAVLEYMTDNYGNRGDKRIEELVDETLLHALDFMAENRREFRNSIDLATLLSRLRSLYMSSRSRDPSLLKMRELSLGITQRAVKSTNKSLLASIRTSCMLYIVLRTFSMRYYVSGGSLEQHSEEALLASL